MLPRQEYGPCGDEKRKAHTPEMPRDTLCALNTAPNKHANVSGGSNESHEAKRKIWSWWIAVFHSSWTRCRFQSVHHLESSNRADHQKRAPIENANPRRSAPRGQPCRCHHVEGECASANIARLGFHDGEQYSTNRETEHRDN